MLQGAPSVPVSLLHDAWALGVLVFEMLTGGPLIEKCGGRDEVRGHPNPTALHTVVK
jgi:hypothetical protein